MFRLVSAKANIDNGKITIREYQVDILELTNLAKHLKALMWQAEQVQNLDAPIEAKKRLEDKLKQEYRLLMRKVV